GESEHDAPDDCLFVRIEPFENFFRSLCDCTFDTAALAVAMERERVIAAALPQLEQSMFEQRQCTRSAANVAQDYVHGARLKAKSYAPRGLFDGLSQHIRVHRTNEELLSRDTRRQIWRGCAFRQEIRPHCQQHCGLAVGN